MAAPGGSVLVLNSGSSSVKFALIAAETGERVLGGLADRVGTSEAVLRVRCGTGDAASEPLPDGSRAAVIARILDRLAPDADLIGVGHRVVHGGERFRASVLVDDEVLAAIGSCARLAPLHNPANLAGIEAVRTARPALPQVAVFDTAFHQTMPASAFRYAVPEEWYTRHDVRRYGFHGTSHRFVSERAAALLGRPLGELRLVTAHLGNGCSAAAIRDGLSVDTTMGLTPLEGLVMGTRSGDIDPGVFAYLAERTGLSAAELTGTLNTRSGLLGLSGASNDMRLVQDAAARGDERARLALDVFVHRLAKAVAGLVTSLDRLDALVFTGGIGENSAVVRGRVLRRLGFLGLAEDPEANAGHGRTAGGRISRPGPVQALVVPTDEELMIARDTARLIAPRLSGVPSACGALSGADFRPGPGRLLPRLLPPPGPAAWRGRLGAQPARRPGRSRLRGPGRRRPPPGRLGARRPPPGRRRPRSRPPRTPRRPLRLPHPVTPHNLRIRRHPQPRWCPCVPGTFL
jgi:acetate kinase